jgi:signal peptidase I
MTVTGALLLGALPTMLGALVLVRRRYLVVTVEGISMMPTLADGDRVLVRRTRPDRIGVGRLVVTEPPTGGRWDAMRLPEWLIKRVAAVPGDLLPRETVPALRDLLEERVPDGQVVLLGDNPAESLDSRFCGYFRYEGIAGVVVRPLPRATPPSRPAPGAP